MLGRKWKLAVIAMAAVTACAGAVPIAAPGIPVLAAEKEPEETSAKLDPYQTVSQDQIQKAFEEYRYEEITRADVNYDTIPKLTGNAGMQAGSLSIESLQDALDAE